MENSAPSLKVICSFRTLCKIVEIKIGGKTRFENLLKQLLIPFAFVGYEVIITNSRYALVDYFITSYPTRAHGIIVIYYSFKIFFHFWLVKTTRKIHHNQLLFTKFAERIFSILNQLNDVKIGAYRELSNQLRQNDFKSAARRRVLNRWPRKPGDKVVLYLVIGKTERNGKTPLRTRKILNEFWSNYWIRLS